MVLQSLPSSSSEEASRSWSGSHDSDFDKNIHVGFKYGTGQQLLHFLQDIVYGLRDSGICVLNELKLNNGMYRHGRSKEFTIIDCLRAAKRKHEDVLLCQDTTTRRKFVLKTIRSGRKLPGIEFQAQHFQSFLPIVFGVYKLKDYIYSFQEYIPGLLKFDEQQLGVFMESLLVAIEFLHSQDLVHFDIKPANIRFKDESNPASLVLIDLESAKHPDFPCSMTGYTLDYLPPWHEQFQILMCNGKYHPALKSGDLWAACCIFLMYLSTTDQNDSYVRHIWNEKFQEIKDGCCGGRDRACYRRGEWPCSDCKEKFKDYLSSDGHMILKVHISRLIDSPNPHTHHFQTMLDVLKYITLVTDRLKTLQEIETKSATKALCILRGTVQQQEIQKLRDLWDQTMNRAVEQGQPSTAMSAVNLRTHRGGRAL